MNIFTNDDYRRIQAWLKANAIKDSDFAVSEDIVPNEDILVITQNISTVPTNYRIRIKDLFNSSLAKIVIDSITAKSVKVNNVLTVDAANVKLDNEKGITLQDVLNYFEDNKLNRHTDDTFDGNLSVKKNITIEGNIKSNDGTTTVEEDLEATGEITDGQGNMLSDVNSAAKGWKIEYQDPQQDEPTVRAKYVLKDYKGVPKGDIIKVYKDSAITNVYLGTIEDTCNPNTGEVTKKPIHDNNEALSIVYRLDTGKYMLVNVPLGIFTREAEFDKYRGLGIEPNGQVFIKLASDIESTNYLHFNSLGEISADGIEARILRDLGTLMSSVAGDSTMWGTYKKHEGTLEDSTPNDGSRWGEYKEAEAYRDALSNSNNIVYHEEWDGSEGPKWEDPVATEASIAYNWKTADTPTSDGKTQGNLKDLYENTLENKEKLSELEWKASEFSKETIETEEDSISIEDNNGNEVLYLDKNGLNAKNVKSNGKDVLTEHQDISRLATKTEVERKQDILIAGDNIIIEENVISTKERIKFDDVILKESTSSHEDPIIIEDSNGNVVANINKDSSNFKNLQSNNVDVLVVGDCYTKNESDVQFNDIKKDLSQLIPDTFNLDVSNEQYLEFRDAWVINGIYSTGAVNYALRAYTLKKGKQYVIEPTSISIPSAIKNENYHRTSEFTTLSPTTSTAIVKGSPLNQTLDHNDVIEYNCQEDKYLYVLYRNFFGKYETPLAKVYEVQQRHSNIQASRGRIDISTSEDEISVFTKMLNAVYEGNVDVHFEKGVYNFESLFEYISEHFDTGTFGYGLPIGGNCRYYFNGSTLIGTTPSTIESNNINVLDDHLVVSDFEINDAKIICINGRYCIHDEADNSDVQYKHVYNNVICEYQCDITQLGPKPFGCGIGFNSILEFNGCVFRSQNSDAPFAIHGPINNPDAKKVNHALYMRNTFIMNGGIAYNSTYLDKTRDNIVNVISGCKMYRLPSSDIVNDLVQFSNDLTVE